MKESVVETILVAIMIIVFILVIMHMNKIKRNTYYECVDYKGNIINCKYINRGSGDILGMTSNGEWIKIMSYKVIYVEGR